MGGRGSSSGITAASPPREFNNYHDAYDFFGVSEASGMFPDWKTGITTDQLDSVVEYTGSYYKHLNDVLRSGKPSKFKATRAKDDAHIQNIDNAISAFTLTENLRVFRGAGTKLINGYSTVAEINANLKGATVQDNGYMSTSAVKGSNFSGQIVYEINVPKGKGRGAFIAPVSKFHHENEFLLARGTKFKVEGARMDGTQVVVSLTVK